MVKGLQKLSWLEEGSLVATAVILLLINEGGPLDFIAGTQQPSLNITDERKHLWIRPLEIKKKSKMWIDF